jgi:hypothetical protein
MNTISARQSGGRGGIPRGLLASGPVILSYGFRPFFLGAAIWACVAMAAWIMTLTGLLAVGGDYGASAWHGHEMLFGFGSAVVAGFLLTAVPNWTGRLPVSGRPLLAALPALGGRSAGAGVAGHARASCRRYWWSRPSFPHCLRSASERSSPAANGPTSRSSAGWAR